MASSGGRRRRRCLSSISPNSNGLFGTSLNESRQLLLLSILKRERWRNIIWTIKAYQKLWQQLKTQSPSRPEDQATASWFYLPSRYPQSQPACVTDWTSRTQRSSLASPSSLTRAERRRSEIEGGCLRGFLPDQGMCYWGSGPNQCAASRKDGRCRTRSARDKRWSWCRRCQKSARTESGWCLAVPSGCGSILEKGDEMKGFVSVTCSG